MAFFRKCTQAAMKQYVKEIKIPSLKIKDGNRYTLYSITRAQEEVFVYTDTALPLSTGDAFFGQADMNWRNRHNNITI